jgi:hypothetical protein
MSTRGCLGAVKGGEFKVAQYCRLESFPKGLGQGIINFFKGTGQECTLPSGTHEITVAIQSKMA